MSEIKLVVLDMAGTTVQDVREVEQCFAQACHEVGLEVSDERILALQGYGKKEVFELLWAEQLPTSHPTYQEVVESSYLLFKTILEKHYQTQPVVPTVGCLEVFSYLRKCDIQIALTTGFYREVADIILGKLGWQARYNAHGNLQHPNGIIDVSVTSDEVPQGRPAPFLIHKAMKLVGVKDPRQVINVGDTPADLQSGHNARCFKSYGVTNGTHTAEQLAPYPHDALLSSLKELIPLVSDLLSMEKGEVFG